jgi:hypothetical protein
MARHVNPQAIGKVHMAKSWVHKPYPKKMYARCSYPELNMLETNGLTAAAHAAAHGGSEKSRPDRYMHIGHVARSRYVVHATDAAGDVAIDKKAVTIAARL